MPGVTPIYGLRYRELGDTPDIPAGTKNLADDTEAVLDGLDDRLDTLEAKVAPQPVQVEDATNDTESSTVYVAGDNPAGTAFTAPPSGKVIIRCYHQIDLPTTTASAFGSFVLRTGATVGSGTVVRAAHDDRSITIGPATTGASGEMSWLEVGLTPGSSYNVQTAQRVTAGSSIIFEHRRLLVEPVL